MFELNKKCYVSVVPFFILRLFTNYDFHSDSSHHTNIFNSTLYYQIFLLHKHWFLGFHYIVSNEWSPHQMQPKTEYFACPNKCGHTYKYKSNVYRHIKYECGKEPQFACEYCGKKYTQRSTVTFHIINTHKQVAKWLNQSKLSVYLF